MQLTLQASFSAGLIAASVNSVVYFGFYNHPTPLAVYGLLNLTVGVSSDASTDSERRSRLLRR